MSAETGTPEAPSLETFLQRVEDLALTGRLDHAQGQASRPFLHVPEAVVRQWGDAGKLHFVELMG